jgi:hypothetical protein
MPTPYYPTTLQKKLLVSCQKHKNNEIFLHELKAITKKAEREREIKTQTLREI